MANIGIITLVERQKRIKSRVSVHVDGEYLGSLEDIVWARSGLKAGDMLDAGRWEDMLGRQEAQAAQDCALKRLASRARSRAELTKHLMEKGFSDEAVQSAIEKLEGYGYLNDAEVAGMAVRDRVGLKPVGRRVLAGELKRMGIGEEDAAAALGQYGQEDELAAALRQAEKDMRRTAGEGDQRKRRAKVYASLARRGFSSDIINKVLNNQFKCSDDD